MSGRLYWIFSLPRSGSSVTAYATAASGGAAVLDEPLGPWDRTGPPYNYPELQRRLMRAYHSHACVLTPEVARLTHELAGLVAGPSGRVVCKHPHLRPCPEEFRAAFPESRAAWVIRNPIHRLNSLFARGWTASLRPNFELEHFKAFARNWRSQEHRVVFEHLKTDPDLYFGAILRAWGWESGPEAVQRARAYTKENYHASSGVKDSQPLATGAPSEREWRLPEEALRTYLSDPFIRELAAECGWPTAPGAYRESASVLGRVWHRAIGHRPAKRTTSSVPPASPASAPVAPMAHKPDRGLEVLWVFSLPRSGSSVTAYACAAALGCAVADEIFGPWDRTGPPYLYPPEQPRLRRAFWDAGERLTPEVVSLADRVMTILDDRDGGASGRIICKVPHLMISPSDLARAYPGARSVWLLRNPLDRLNSLVLRGWHASIQPDHDLARYKEFARRWHDQPGRVTYTQLRADPRGFFSRVLGGLGVDASETRVDAACAYAAQRYHRSSMQVDAQADPSRPASEADRRLTEDVVRAYLDDDAVRDVMVEQGWSVEASDYLAPAPT